MILSNKRIKKALIRLHICGVWSAPLLFPNPQRQVFLRCPSKLLITNLVVQLHYQYGFTMWIKTRVGPKSAGFIRSKLVWIYTIFKTGFRIFKKVCTVTQLAYYKYYSISVFSMENSVIQYSAYQAPSL